MSNNQSAGNDPTLIIIGFALAFMFALSQCEGSQHSSMIDNTNEEKIPLLVDVQTKRPGCVLLQACAGCAASNTFLEMLFDTKTWILAPTARMVVVHGTAQQWRALARKLNS